MATPLAKLKRMSESEFKKQSKDSLFKIIQEDPYLADLEAMDQDIRNLNRSLKDTASKMSELNKSMEHYRMLEQRVTKVEESNANQRDEIKMHTVDIDGMKSNQVRMNKTLDIHHDAMQSLLIRRDIKDRKCNVVLSGVSESENLDGKDVDHDKCNVIFEKIKIEKDDLTFTCKRLGRPGNDRTRKILVKFTNEELRDDVLKKAKELKKAGNSYKDIYINKDENPGYRREKKRLHDRLSNEKEKPENVDKELILNRYKWQVEKDGEVIDKMKINVSDFL